MEVFDLLIGEDLDLQMDAGDLVVGESTLQHQRDILLAEKGQFRQSPLLGVGINRELLNTIGEEGLRGVIQSEMERDGMRIKRLVINGGLDVGDIELIASYGRA